MYSIQLFRMASPEDWPFQGWKRGPGVFPSCYLLRFDSIFEGFQSFWRYPTKRRESLLSWINQAPQLQGQVFRCLLPFTRTTSWRIGTPCVRYWASYLSESISGKQFGRIQQATETISPLPTTESNIHVGTFKRKDMGQRKARTVGKPLEVPLSFSLLCVWLTLFPSFTFPHSNQRPLREFHIAIGGIITCSAEHHISHHPATRQGWTTSTKNVDLIHIVRAKLRSTSLVMDCRVLTFLVSSFLKQKNLWFL